MFAYTVKMHVVHVVLTSYPSLPAFIMLYSKVKYIDLARAKSEAPINKFII